MMRIRLERFRSIVILRRGKSVLFLLILVAFRPATFAQMQTSTHRLEDLAVGAATTDVSSTSTLRIQALVGELVAGPAQAPFLGAHYGTSDVGSVMTPIVLTANPDPVNPAHVDLTWTGADAPFLVYRATDCAQISLPGTLLVTEAGLSYTDTSPPPGALTCYNVRGTPPAP